MNKEYQDILYKKEEIGLTLFSCGEIYGDILVPDELDGEKVRSIAPYAFSGKDVESLSLPESLGEIGRYAFYRCFSLKKLRFSDRLKEIGAGAFTGCRLEELKIDFYDGNQSVLKFILDEIRYLVRVTLYFHSGNGETRTARLIFPEHYEEAVENTPARLLVTHHHGSGNDYRQCFYNREVKFEDYDSLLPRAVAEEPEEIVSELSVLRLQYPYQLSDRAKERYEAYLRAHIEAAGMLFTEREDMETLKFLSSSGYFSERAMEKAIETAAEGRKTAVLSMLMDEKRRCFQRKKKVFEL